jgi:hypothetical protein
MYDVRCRLTDFTYTSRRLCKVQNGWKGKGNHRCDGGNTVVSSPLQFPFVFALKLLAGQKFQGDEVVKNEGTTRLREQAA